MFDNYLSESTTNNHIYMKFSVSTLKKALSNKKADRIVRMKLSCYRGTPGLLFDMEVFILMNYYVDA